VGDGYWCSGKLPDVLADDARFSTFYSVSDVLLVLQYASSQAEGGIGCHREKWWFGLRTGWRVQTQRHFLSRAEGCFLGWGR